jgi:hypothetical protein
MLIWSGGGIGILLTRTPKGIYSRLPAGARIKRVVVNGHQHPGFEGEWIILKGLTGKANIVAYTA